MSDWIAIGRRAGAGVVAHAMRGATWLSAAQAADEAGALAGLGQGDGKLVRIGDGTPDALPAPVLPKGGATCPALTQDSPPDVIGAWVRIWIAGFLASRENWDGIICAQEGGISHWLHISADEVVSCQSFLTPRLNDALGGADCPDDTALADSLSRPERLAAHLRAAEVAGNAGALTGHLIGAELAAARAYWLGQQVAVIGDRLGYSGALRAQGVPVEEAETEALEPLGLQALGTRLGLAG
ncbi:2-dehydro-3-deoxygalactonokinase [Roseovarius sp. A21]|uniref:2-dehydro-3-deoxygalactonokinase n=1 Tax=Roseovarius bejariae TaxID=2576383 RepID=A0A844CMB9_9RHOB|nr:2-dehydro-3-deoxygalactonokinase [Roseovarius bejariae]MRU15927.1 2-dehydro-3-deoxygalactonokinase [Roseovarius bejariae]